MSRKNRLACPGSWAPRTLRGSVLLNGRRQKIMCDGRRDPSGHWSWWRWRCIWIRRGPQHRHFTHLVSDEVPGAERRPQRGLSQEQLAELIAMCRPTWRGSKPTTQPSYAPLACCQSPQGPGCRFAASIAEANRVLSEPYSPGRVHSSSGSRCRRLRLRCQWFVIRQPTAGTTVRSAGPKAIIPHQDHNRNGGDDQPILDYVLTRFVCREGSHS